MQSLLGLCLLGNDHLCHNFAEKIIVVALSRHNTSDKSPQGLSGGLLLQHHPLEARVDDTFFFVVSGVMSAKSPGSQTPCAITMVRDSTLHLLSKASNVFAIFVSAGGYRRALSLLSTEGAHSIFQTEVPKAVLLCTTRYDTLSSQCHQDVISCHGVAPSSVLGRCCCSSSLFDVWIFWSLIWAHSPP